MRSVTFQSRQHPAPAERPRPDGGEWSRQGAASGAERSGREAEGRRGASEQERSCASGHHPPTQPRVKAEVPCAPPGTQTGCLSRPDNTDHQTPEGLRWGSASRTGTRPRGDHSRACKGPGSRRGPRPVSPPPLPNCPAPGAGATRRRPARGSRARVTEPGRAAARGPQVHSGSLTVLGRTELVSSAVSRASRRLPVASSLGQTLSLLCVGGRTAHPPPRGPDSEPLVFERRPTWANRPDRHSAQLPSHRRLQDHPNEQKSKRNRTRRLREAPVRLAAGRHSGPVGAPGTPPGTASPASVCPDATPPSPKNEPCSAHRVMVQPPTAAPAADTRPRGPSAPTVPQPLQQRRPPRPGRG